MVSRSERCGVCGRAVTRTGSAKAYVHENQFHQRFNHAAIVYKAPARALVWATNRQGVIDVRDAERVSV